MPTAALRRTGGCTVVLCCSTRRTIDLARTHAHTRAHQWSSKRYDRIAAPSATISFIWRSSRPSSNTLPFLLLMLMLVCASLRLCAALQPMAAIGAKCCALPHTFAPTQRHAVFQEQSNPRRTLPSLARSFSLMPLRLARQSWAPSATVRMQAADANALGQDLGEQFELYAGPLNEAPTILSAPPTPLGVRKARGEVHRDGDWHRSVHVWLGDEMGRLLLQRRSEHKDTHPGLWDVSCAGHISAGDGSLDTAQKELEEELGFAVGLAELEACFVATFASTMRGITAKHGAFECNEYQDIYLFITPSASLDADKLVLGAGEVAGVQMIDATELISAWEREDAQFVPRSALYAHTLRAAVDKTAKAATS